MGLMLQIFFGEFTDCKCQVAAWQTLGTIHTFTIVEVVVTVIGTDLLISKMNAEFQFRMDRSIELQHGFGIDDACHAQKLAFIGSGRSENPDGREIQALADMLKQ